MTKPSRHAMIETTCQLCGVKFMARRQRVEKGQSRFCSQAHYKEWLKAQGSQRKNIGKENAIVSWDSSLGIYRAYWYDNEMKYHSSAWVRWWWELNKGEIPEGYYASCIDGNSKNINPENICLKTMAEISGIGERSRGVPKSTEVRKKISEAHTGKILSDEHKTHISDALRAMWNKGVFDSPETREAYSRQGRLTRGSKRTPEQREKMSETRKGRKVPFLHTAEAIAKRATKIRGRKQTEEANEKRRMKLIGREVSEEHRKNLSKSLKGVYVGEKASGYKDGKSLLDYPRDFGAYLKGLIRRRDENICRSCKEDVSGKGKGQIHHIDNDKLNNEEYNLILLCVPCHQAVHGKRNLTNETIEYLKERLLR